MQFDEPAEGVGSGNFLSHLPTILWQRKWWIIVPAILGTIGALIAVLVIPPIYRSNAVMLVESPQLPNEILTLDGSELIDRRIARIKQQITARPDLINLIERHGLYQSQRRGKSLSAIVDDMRDAIVIVPNQVGKERAGAQSSNTIAFELSFSYGQPVPAQAVAQDLMNQVLQLDASGNVEQATNTVQFLTDQSAGLEQQIAQLQGQIGNINAANGGVLSGGAGIISNNSGSYDMQIASLQRENQQLLLQRTTVLGSDQRDPVVVAAEQQLAAARAVYSESHPDVVTAKQRLAEAKLLAKSNTAKLPIDTIDQQIAFNNAQIGALRSAKSMDESQTRSRIAAQSRAPLVQQQIGELQQQLSTVNQRYEEVQNRLMAAKAGVRAEDEQMGERLVVVEPPVVPDAPESPNRLLLAAAGIIGGLGLGIVLALAIELLMQPIRDPQTLRGIPGATALGMVPFIESRKTPSQKRRWWPFPRRSPA